MMDSAALEESARGAIAAAQDVRGLAEVRVGFLGKKGEMTALLKDLGQLPPDQRPAAGAEINRLKQALQQALNQRRGELEAERLAQQLEQERIDVTLPGRGESVGSRSEEHTSELQ